MVPRNTSVPLDAAEGSPRKRQLAAVMFTDLVGYSSTVHRDEEAGRRVRFRHRASLEGALALHQGTLLQYFGDGSLCIFPSAVEAVAAAGKIQIEFGQHGEGALRIGIDLGDIAYDEQGAYGDAVNIASRLESLSEPGGVIFSGKVQKELRNHPEFETVSLGEVPLRNIDGPVAVFALRGEGIQTPDRVREKKASYPETPSLPGPGPRTVRTILEELCKKASASLESRRAGRGEDGPLPGPITLVGREGELARLRALSKSAAEGSGKAVFLRGDRGVGKSQLVSQLLQELAGEGWLVIRGQAYAAEEGVPFSPFANAFGPLLQGLEHSEVQLLAQGGARDLAALWPPLAQGELPGLNLTSGAGEARSRFFWTFTQFLATLSAAQPLALLLEDLEWADASSLDLLHFLARQIGDRPILLVGLFCEADVVSGSTFPREVASLERSRLACCIEVTPLSKASTLELVTRVFDVPAAVVEGFVQRLYDWTQGNTFFLERALEALVESGALHEERGRWLGWEIREMDLPATVRDAILTRADRLATKTRTVAELAALMGGQVTFGALRAALNGRDDDLVPALQELTDRGVFVEGEAGNDIVYRFSHPLIPQTLEASLPLGVARSLHAQVAMALERYYGSRAEEYADELAYHYVRAHGDTEPGKALHYLASAGRRALERSAYREAARYLQAALSRYEALAEGASAGAADRPRDPHVSDRQRLLEGLARARAALGEQDEAIQLWREALGLARASGDGAGMANLHRRIGRAHLSQGRLGAALKAFDLGMEAAREAGDRFGEARLRLVQGVSLQQAGRSAEAAQAVEKAQEIASELGVPEMLVQTNRGLLLIHLWRGKLDLVREKGLEVRRMAGDLGDPQLMFWAEWTLAAAAGLRGNTDELQLRITELERLAEKARSPDLSLWATELSLEYAYASGAWDIGLGIGEQAAALGRALSERTILPRILVNLALIYLGRGEMDRAQELVEEAWDTSGAAGAGAGMEFLDVHTVVPAHIGRVAWLNASEDWDGAVEVARAGVELADRTGYVIWGIHKLLPLLAIAYMYSGRISEAEEIGERLRKAGEEMDHDLARAWGRTGGALVAWLKGDPETGARLMREASDLLEKIPMIFDAARVRRQLAGRLWDIGEGQAALSELRRAHRQLTELGAGPEIEKALVQFEEMGVKG